VREPDLNRIESELGIRLPGDYRTAMLAYPVAVCAGNHDSEFWHDADRLIALNKELRAGRFAVKPWPAAFFATRPASSRR
jgi:hypothetical protein